MVEWIWEKDSKIKNFTRFYEISAVRYKGERIGGHDISNPVTSNVGWRGTHYYGPHMSQIPTLNLS
jgi:hypothetical protein